MKQALYFLTFFLVINSALAQNVGIGTTTPNPNSLLEINSSTKGVLISRTSTATRITIPAVKGLLVYDTTTNSFWFNDGSNWIESLNGNTGWGTKGNSNTNPSINFLGTGDNQPLRFRLNNGWAGEWNKTNRNFSIGDGALQDILSGTGNIAMGSGAMRGFTNSNGMIAIGDSAMANLTAGSGANNIAIGQRALFANTSGGFNTAVGVAALGLNKDGNSNVAIGPFAMLNNKSGSRSIAIGRNALFADTSSTACIAIGTAALAKKIASSTEIAIGDSAMYNVQSLTLVPAGGIAIGDHALFKSVQNNNQIAIGHRALMNFNAAFGGENIAIGIDAQKNLTAAGYNIALGNEALLSNATGIANVAIGYQALYFSTGMNNVAIGTQALGFILTGGSNNTAIGSNADFLFPNRSLDYATAIGAQAAVGCNNCLVLGGSTANTRTKVGINQSTPFTDLHIIQQSDDGLDKTRGIRIQRSTGTNQWRTLIDPSNNYIFEYNNSLYSYINPSTGAFVNPSDARLKKDIFPLDNILDKVMLLQPKTYHYINSEDTLTKLYGFIAQDVEKLFPAFIHEGQNGYKGIAYHNFGIIAIKAIQELNEKNDRQQQLIDELVKKVAALEKSIDK